MKRQDIDWEKIFANHMPEKELVSRIYKELSKLNSKKINIPIKTWTKDRRHFTKGWQIST